MSKNTINERVSVLEVHVEANEKQTCKNEQSIEKLENQLQKKLEDIDKTVDKLSDNINSNLIKNIKNFNNLDKKITVLAVKVGIITSSVTSIVVSVAVILLRSLIHG